MRQMIEESARLGFVVLLGSILTVGICDDASARVHKRHLGARSSAYQSHAQLAPQQPAGLGTMRYYGGPKSPMWR